MLVDILSVSEAVRFAQRIARKMSKTDPEIDSVAGEAAWRALYTYDQKKGVKLSWWIAQLTKQSVVHYWRRMARLREHEKLMDELWWQEQSNHGRVTDTDVRYPEDNLCARRKDDADVPVSADDWQLLVESYVLKWPLDVIAREHGMSLSQARSARCAAVSRLEAVC